MNNNDLINTSEWKLPDSVKHIYGPKVYDWAVVVPVINEGEKLKLQLNRMLPFCVNADIVVADGGSKDNSVSNLSGIVRAVLVKQGSGKLSAQLRMAFAWCYEQGYKGVIIIDGNGKDGVEAIPKFIEKLESGFDFVQGSRYVPGGVAINTPIDRHIAVRLLHAPLISMASRFWYTDTTNGFRGFSIKFLTDKRVSTFREIFDTYNLHYYLSIRAPRLGFKVCEIPVTRAYPSSGKTPTKISGMSGRILILKQLFMAVFGLYNPKGV